MSPGPRNGGEGTFSLRIKPTVIRAFRNQRWVIFPSLAYRNRNENMTPAGCSYVRSSFDLNQGSEASTAAALRCNLGQSLQRVSLFGFADAGSMHNVSQDTYALVIGRTIHWKRMTVLASMSVGRVRPFSL